MQSMNQPKENPYAAGLLELVSKQWTIDTIAARRVRHS